MDERIWSDRPLEPGARVERSDCVVMRESPGHLYLISGHLVTALKLY